MNNTLANGLALLRFLSGTAERFGVSELAARLELPKSHVHRLLRTLVETGYAVQEPDRRYRIGLRPLEVSCALLQHLPLRVAAVPLIHLLAKSTGMDAITSIPFDGAGLIVAAIHPDGRQRDPSASIGGRLHPDHTATGKAFSVLIHGFAPPPKLSTSELARIRRDRFAIKDPTLAAPMNGMAAVVADASGTVLGALGLAAPGEDFRRHFAKAAAALRAAATELEARLARPEPVSEPKAKPMEVRA